MANNVIPGTPKPMEPNEQPQQGELRPDAGLSLVAQVAAPQPQPMLAVEEAPDLAQLAEAAPVSSPEAPAAPDPMAQLDALTGTSRLDDDYLETLAKRETDANLKWFESYAKERGLIAEEPAPTAEQGAPAQNGAAYNPWAPRGALYKSAYDTTVAAANNALDAIPSIPGGVIKGVQNSLNAFGALADWINQRGYGLPGGVQITDPKTGELAFKILNADEFKKFREEGGSQEIALLGAELGQDTPAGKLVGAMAQFLGGLGVAGRLTGGLATGNTWAEATKRLGQYVFADFLSWDAQDGNLANLVQLFPALQNPVTEFLATDQDTPELEGRVKNAIAGTPLNAASELVLQWLKGIREARKLKELTGSSTVSEAAQKLAQPLPSRVEQILGRADDELVKHIERQVPAVDVGVPPQVAAKSLAEVAGSHKPPDIAPGLKRIYRVMQEGEYLPKYAYYMDDLGRAKDEMKAKGKGFYITYNDIPAGVKPSRPGEYLIRHAWVKGKAGAPDLTPPPVSLDVYVNWNKINAPEDVKAAMGQMADAFAPEIDAARRGVVSNAETMRLAGDENAWRLLIGERKGNLPLAHEQAAMRQLWAASGQKLMETAKLAATGSLEDQFAFRKMLATHAMIQKEVIGVRTETARALQQWRMPMGGTEEQLRQLQTILDANGGESVTRALAERIAVLADKPEWAGAVDQLARKGAFAKTMDVVREVWINAILSGPKTHLVNTMSNTMVAGQSIIERALAGKLGSVLDPVTGVHVGEATAMGWGIKQAYRDAFSYAWRVLKTGESGYGLAKIEGPRVPAISAEALDIQNSMAARGVDMLGKFVSVSGRALVAEDEFFKTINYRAELWAQAYRMASEERLRGLLAPENLKARVAEIIMDPPENIRLKAADMAAYNTFTSAPGQAVKKIMALRNAPGFQWLQFVIPFVNTLANIFKYTMERTPLAPLFAKFRADVAAGGARRDLALARMGLGTMVMTVAFDMALDGTLTGGGPEGDKKASERQALARGGWQRYSVRVQTGTDADGNPIYRYFAYNRADPLGMLLGIAADIGEHVTNSDARVDAQFEEVFTAAILSAASNMMDKSYLSGFASFVDAVREPERYGTGFFERFGSSFVPTGVAEIARFVDPHLKFTSDLASGLRARTPGLSETVPNRLDMWGEPIKYTSGLGPVYDALSPIYSKSTAKAEAIDREFFKLEFFPTDTTTIQLEGSNDGRRLAPSLRNRPEIVNEYKTLAAKTSAGQLLEANSDDMKKRGGGYRAYAKRLSQMGERTMKEALNDLVTGKLDALSSDYAEAATEDKIEIIQDIMRAYRGAARVSVIRDHPELQELRDSMPSRGEGASPF